MFAGILGNSSQTWVANALRCLLGRCVIQLMGVGNRVQGFPSNLDSSLNLINPSEVLGENYNPVNQGIHPLNEWQQNATFIRRR
jgi:hypothetical protein